MRKQDPNTHCFAVRCPLQVAAKIVTDADEKGITASALIGAAAAEKVKNVKASPKSLKWAAGRRAVYAERRRKMDELYGKRNKGVRSK